MSDRANFLKNRKKSYILKALHNTTIEPSFRDDLQGIFFTGPSNDVHTMATSAFSALRTYTSAISNVESALDTIKLDTQKINSSSTEEKKIMLDNDDNEIDEDLAMEINILKTGNPDGTENEKKTKNRFYKIKPNIKGSIFIGWPRIDGNAPPDNTVTKLIKVVLSNGLNLKNLSRAIPIFHTCKYVCVQDDEIESNESTKNDKSDNDPQKDDEKKLSIDKEPNNENENKQKEKKPKRKTIVTLNDELLKTQLIDSIDKALLQRVTGENSEERIKELTKVVYADIKVRNNSSVTKPDLAAKVMEWCKNVIPSMGQFVTNDNRFAKFTVFVQVNMSWALTGAIISENLCDCSLTAALKKSMEMQEKKEEDLKNNTKETEQISIF